MVGRCASQTKDNLVCSSNDVIDNWINIDLLRQGKHWWTSKHKLAGRGKGNCLKTNFGWCEGWSDHVGEMKVGNSRPGGCQQHSVDKRASEPPCYFKRYFRPTSTSKWGRPELLYFSLFLDISTSRLTARITLALGIFPFPADTGHRSKPQWNYS